MSGSRVWLITGSSSGFGRNMTELALSCGETVVATLRKPSDLDDLVIKYPSSHLLVIKCDVTKPEDIASAFARTKQQFGRCDVVFNNAGFSTLGEVEGTPDDVARRLMEVNFWGAANVNKEAVKFFREVNPPGVGGRLIITSSICGVQGVPGYGYYSASKFALEGVTQALAAELDPAWNIKITLVDSGGFRTNILTGNFVDIPVHPAYVNNPNLQSQMMRARTGQPSNGDPSKAVDRIFKLSKEVEPPVQIPLGKDAIFLARMKIKSFTENVNKYESWSEDLVFLDGQ